MLFFPFYHEKSLPSTRRGQGHPGTVILSEVKDPVVRKQNFCLRDSSPLRGSE